MRYALAALGFAAIVGASLPQLATIWWVFELFTHFRVQMIAVLAVLAMVFAARRAWGWCLALALCMAVNARPLVPYLMPATRPAGEPTLTLINVNVRARSAEHAGLLDSIAATAPDVVLVVEFTAAWGERLAPLASEYPYQYLLPRDDPFGIALFSRHPLENTREIPLGMTSAIDAFLRTPQGPLRLIGVHLPPPLSAGWARERNRELEALAEHLAGMRTDAPLVVAGDFNMTPFSPYFGAWLEQTGLRDARAGFGLEVTWPTFQPLLGIPIDHCIVGDGLAVAEFRRLAAFGSDHRPVLVRLVQERTT